MDGRVVFGSVSRLANPGRVNEFETKEGGQQEWLLKLSLSANIVIELAL